MKIIELKLAEYLFEFEYQLFILMALKVKLRENFDRTNSEVKI